MKRTQEGTDMAILRVDNVPSISLPASRRAGFPHAQLKLMLRFEYQSRDYGLT